MHIAAGQHCLMPDCSAKAGGVAAGSLVPKVLRAPWRSGAMGVCVLYRGMQRYRDYSFCAKRITTMWVIATLQQILLVYALRLMDDQQDASRTSLKLDLVARSSEKCRPI